MRSLVLFAVMFILFSVNIFAGGYQVRLQGQRQTGMGLTGTTITGDASSLFYNPAGLSRISGKYSFSIGSSAIFSSTGFQAEGSSRIYYNDNPVSTPFYLYGSALLAGKLGIGVGAYTPYGSSARWAKDWIGAGLVQEISLKSLFIQPTLSYQFGDFLSVGAGLVYAAGSFDLRRALPYNSPTINGQVHLNGEASAFGYNVGLLVTPGKKWSIGVSYRSEVTMKVEDGVAHFKVPQSLGQIIPSENTFSSELPLPANLDAGISFRPTERLLLAAEINYVFWETYDTLKFTFEKNPDQLNSSNPRLYSNSLITRLGAEYRFSEIVTGRLGFYYDPAPTNENYFTPETPSLNSYGITAGVSVYPAENFAIEISYLQLETSRSFRSYDPASFKGYYKTRTIIPGVGIRYNF